MEIDLKLVINDLADQIKRLMIENAFLKAQIKKLESDKKE
jgi:cell division protein FtsB